LTDLCAKQEEFKYFLVPFSDWLRIITKKTKDKSQ